MKYRKAKETDYEQIGEVLLKNYNLKNITEAIQVAKDELEMFNCIVAEHKGQVVGVSFWRVQGLPKHRLVESVRLAVLPEYRGRGVARTLFKDMIQDAHKYYRAHNLKIRKLYVHAHANNKKAIEFYKRRGMIHEATLKNHFYDGEDEHIFSMFFG